MEMEKAKLQIDSDTSIIVFAQKLIGVSNFLLLRYPPYVVDFIELILSDEVRSNFPIQQYRYAANLIYGHKLYISDEEIFRYLHKVGNEYKKYL